MEHKTEKVKESTPTSSESRGVLGSMWSAAGHLVGNVQHAVQETVERIQHEPITSVSGYVAHKVVDTASAVYHKTAHVVENAVPSAVKSEEPTTSIADKIDSFFSSPTDDLMAATKEEKKIEESIKDEAPNTDKFALVKKSFHEAFADVAGKLDEGLRAAKQALPDSISTSININASDLLAAQNSIAQKNIDTASKTVQDKKETVNIPQSERQLNNLESQVKNDGEFKLELSMEVVAHLQRIADRTGDAILHETARKAHSACAKGVSDAPGVHLVRITPEQATELVNLAIRTQDHQLADFARYCQSVAATSQIGIEPSPGKIMEELAKGRQELNQQGRVHTGPGYGAAFASVGRAAPQTATPTATPAQPTQTPSVPEPSSSSSNLQLNMEMVAHLQRIADRTGDQVLHETARKAHSACAKGSSEAPGVYLVNISPDQASELVNLAIRTQDTGLANFARYCQSVAATNQVGIEPSPGKIANAIAKGQQDLAQQGRVHTGPGYGAAFASISRSTSQQNLISRSGSQQNIAKLGSASQQNGLNRSVSMLNLPIKKSPSSTNISSTAKAAIKPSLQLTMDVVAHLQRIADRTGDALLHETARKAHSACAKNLNEAPGVHLTWVTPEHATELVNLAIRTQDHELADFARYCQSVAATSQIGIEPSPGKIQEEIKKGRQELEQGGRAHTGPGYGAAFASAAKVQQRNEQGELKAEPQVPTTSTTLVGQSSQ